MLTFISIENFHKDALRASFPFPGFFLDPKFLKYININISSHQRHYTKSPHPNAPRTHATTFTPALIFVPAPVVGRGVVPLPAEVPCALGLPLTLVCTTPVFVAGIVTVLPPTTTTELDPATEIGTPFTVV